jgi:hypothetical protein
LIERLTDDKTNSDESLRVLLRLLIDEIVEDLSRRHRIQEQISSSLGDAASR